MKRGESLNAKSAKREKRKGDAKRGSQRDASLDFLALDVLEDVPLEEARATEERIFRIRHALSVQKPLFDKGNGAHEVCDLKQLVASTNTLNMFLALGIEGFQKKEMVAGIPSRHQREVSVPASR